MPTVKCSTQTIGAGPSVACQLVSTASAPSSMASLSRRGQPVPLPLERYRISGDVTDAPRRDGGGAVEAVLDAVDGAGVARIRSHCLPTAAIAACPGVLVELARLRWK
jgi:hypothetical protein